MQIPSLSECNRLTLQNLMLRAAVEEERIEKLKACLSVAGLKLHEAHAALNTWKTEYNDILREHNLDITMVNIDAETGEVTLADNIRSLSGSEKVDATG